MRLRAGCVGWTQIAGSSAASPPPRTGSVWADGVATGITAGDFAALADNHRAMSCGARPGATSVRLARSGSALKAHSPTPDSAT